MIKTEIFLMAALICVAPQLSRPWANGFAVFYLFLAFTESEIWRAFWRGLVGP